MCKWWLVWFAWFVLEARGAPSAAYGLRDVTEEWGVWDGKAKHHGKDWLEWNERKLASHAPLTQKPREDPKLASSPQRDVDRNSTKMKPLSQSLYSAYLSGAYGVYDGVNTGLQSIYPVGTGGTVPTDTPNKSWLIWFNLQNWPNDWPMIYDSTGTRSTPSFGHRLYVSKNTPSSADSGGTLILQDWAGNYISVNGISLGVWYCAVVTIQRDPNAHTAYALLFVTYAGNINSAWVGSSQFTYLSIVTYATILLGGKGYSGNSDDPFAGYLDNFAHWNSAITNPSWNPVSNAQNGDLSSVTSTLLGYYPMPGGVDDQSIDVTPVSGNYQVTGMLNVLEPLTAQYVETGHSPCSCYGRVNDPNGQCLGLSTSCSNYCDQPYLGVVCLQCVAGYYTNNGASTCTACWEGSYSTTAYATSSYVCNNCATNYYSLAGWTTCVTCPAGQYFDFTTACTNCPTGWVSATSGLTVCTACPAGTYATSAATACVSCSPGYFSYGLVTTCSACGAGSYQPYASATTCYVCPAGSYSSSATATACTTCPTGTYGTSSGLSVCTNCAAGTSSSATGATTSGTCVQCAVGSYSSAGAYHCPGCQPYCGVCSPPAYSNGPNGPPGSVSESQCAGTCSAVCVPH